jgi:cell shape-determining protein MreD
MDYAFSSHDERLPFFALFVGLARDFAGGHLFGIETFSFTLTGLLLYLALLKLDRENYFIGLGLTFLFVLLTESLKLAFGTGIEISRGFSWNLLGGVFLTAFYTTACAPGFFWFANRWFKRTAVFRQYELFG